MFFKGRGYVGHIKSNQVVEKYLEMLKSWMELHKLGVDLKNI